MRCVCRHHRAVVRLRDPGPPRPLIRRDRVRGGDGARSPSLRLPAGGRSGHRCSPSHCGHGGPPASVPQPPAERLRGDHREVLHRRPAPPRDIQGPLLPHQQQRDRRIGPRDCLAGSPADARRGLRRPGGAGRWHPGRADHEPHRGRVRRARQRQVATGRRGEPSPRCRRLLGAGRADRGNHVGLTGASPGSGRHRQRAATRSARRSAPALDAVRDDSCDRQPRKPRPREHDPQGDRRSAVARHHP